VLGLPIKRRQVAYQEIRAVEERHGTVSQQGSKHRIDYNVVAVTAAGELVLAEQLDSHSKTKRVVAFFRKQLKLKGKVKAGEAELVIEVE
jgi:virulence-associated protein VapD